MPRPEVHPSGGGRSSFRHRAALMAARLMVLSPVSGMLVGCVVAYVAFNADSMYSGSGLAYDFAFTCTYGVPFGAVVGGICGVLAFWPLRHAHPLKIAVYLGVASLVGGVGPGLIPGAGVVLALLGCVAGFWVGFWPLVLEGVSSDSSDS